jgi:rod shape-determining protein MreC
MIFDHHNKQTGSIRQSLSVLTYPLQYMIHAPVEASHWLVKNLFERSVLIAENDALKETITLLKAQQLKLDALNQENARLRALFDSAQKIQERILITELLRVEMDPYQHQVVINKGRNDEIYSGQALIDSTGVVGQVVHTSFSSANVMLITDPSHAIPVQINRNNLRTIAVGSGHSDRLNLPYLPQNSDVKMGDLLTTSGLGGVFPEGYPVGIVTNISQSNSQPFPIITAKPLANLESSRELLLVWKNDPEDDVPSKSITEFDLSDQAETEKSKDEKLTEQNNIEDVE